ncbi:hypothetical protein NSK_005422 [Nannochloropsis salina CCMP1776]|uniref:Major facilitator superfamily (MFS) profile domain-containing protein n=1 Tax=Nannochloropsis salina CCMP1776 TaxID=1027361 RepID=A0A4D9CVN9_9STRA|nr:hypothetical protein NSK_005422 [Nannochloropsis salina CCMP1776]|eukprot:TFJ83260.1 hypothetical protein NSK_005422 [Nannochloropsis salina CCMP1776]
MPSFPDTKGNAEGGEKEEEEEEEEREEEKEGELRKVTEIEADHWPDAGSHRSYMVGPVLGAGLYTLGGFRLPFLVLGLCPLFACMILPPLLREGLRRSRSLYALRSSRPRPSSALPPSLPPSLPPPLKGFRLASFFFGLVLGSYALLLLLLKVSGVMPWTHHRARKVGWRWTMDLEGQGGRERGRGVGGECLGGREGGEEDEERGLKGGAA